MLKLNEIHNTDCILGMGQIESETIDCCVTSPPYFGLRDYGSEGQIGLEPTPEDYIDVLLDVFREVRRVLKPDGTLWLNLGDSYSSVSGSRNGYNDGRKNRSERQSAGHVAGIKTKDLMGIPWMVAFALRADGWYLRQDIIWHKPNPMPESVTDRCTKSHEYIFLLSKSPRYYFDNIAISEPVTATTISRLLQPNLENQAGSNRVPGKTNGPMKAKPPKFGGNKYGFSGDDHDRTKSGNEYQIKNGTRNKRSVWIVTTKPFKEAHFATYPPDLIEPCILAGCRPGGIVLDPFMGAGTTALVAARNGRDYIGFELNPEYCEIAKRRIKTVQIQMA